MADTATKLLDEAQLLVQERGFNAFSYKDLAERIGIRTASIHYHFQAKADLGVALMERYHEGLEEALSALDAAGGSARERLRGFIGLYRTTERRGAVCLCGSLASDRETLPPALQDRVAAYLERSQAWVAATLRDGVRKGEFALTGAPKDAAALLVAGLQGGLVLARAQGGSLLKRVERTFFALLTDC